MDLNSTFGDTKDYLVWEKRIRRPDLTAPELCGLVRHTSDIFRSCLFEPQVMIKLKVATLYFNCLNRGYRGWRPGGLNALPLSVEIEMRNIFDHSFFYDLFQPRIGFRQCDLSRQTPHHKDFRDALIGFLTHYEYDSRFQNYHYRSEDSVGGPESEELLKFLRSLLEVLMIPAPHERHRAKYKKVVEVMGCYRQQLICALFRHSPVELLDLPFNRSDLNAIRRESRRMGEEDWSDSKQCKSINRRELIAIIADRLKG